MKRRVIGLSVLLTLVFAARNISAQTNPNFEIGLKPYGSFEGGNFDSVSLTNGNLTLHIPLFSYPQRGAIPANLNISYNNKSWYVFQTCQLAVCTDQWKWNPNLTYGAYLNFDGGAAVIATVVNGQYQFTAYTSDGSSHEMPGNGSSSTMTVDGSGIYYNGATGGNGLTPLTRLRNGSQPLTADANGNLATSTNPGLNHTALAWVSTDTLSRNVGGTTTSTSDYSGCVAPPSPTQINSASILTLPGTNRQIKTCSANYSLQTNFQQYDSNAGTPILEGTATASFVVSIVLYNGVSWSSSPAWGFDYVSRDSGDSSSVNYGDLTRVTMPTGGTVSYQWGTRSLCTGWNALTQVSRGIAARTVNAQDGTGDKKWMYVGSLVTDPDNNQTLHQISDLGGCAFYETLTKWYQGSQATGQLMKTVQTDYTYSTGIHGSQPPDPVVKVFPIRTTTTWPNGQVTKIEKDYDANGYGQVTAVREYNYGSGAPGSLVRTTTNVYQSTADSNYLAANLLDLLSSTTVKDGSGNQVSQTTYAYDGSSLQPSGVTTQHDNSKADSRRGNLTQVCRWLNTTAGNPCTSTIYYDTGLPYSSTDANGNTTTFTYSATYYGAYPTQTALPDTYSPNLTHHVVSGTYDFNTGSLVSFTDQNSQTSNYSYDSLGRLTSAAFPDGGSTSFSFGDAALNNYVERDEAITGSLTNRFRVYFDGLARKKQTQLLSDPGGTVFTDLTYDNEGRLFKQSNPYRSVSDTTYGLTAHYYDVLNRETLLVPPDGTTSSNNVQTQYCAGTTLVKDQSGHWRRSTADALGRLVEVDEPNSTTATVNVCPGTGEPIWVTSYTYDSLDNLKTVIQNSSRSRSFSYDSLKRLTSASNPEAGTITYTYDPNGNVTSKKDARGLSSLYYYDSLNRLLAKRFSDSTPGATYLFDGALPTTSSSSGTGTVTISGTEQSFLLDCTKPPCPTIYDTGTVSVTVGSITKTVNYGRGSTYSTIATAIASAFNSDLTALVNATVSSGQITFTARLTGAVTNYPLSVAVTYDQSNFTDPSFHASRSGATLTGGSGTCAASGINLTVNYGVGHRTAMCDAAGGEGWSFDKMGRQSTEQRTTSSITKTTSYSYNLNGSVATMTYPSGRTITYAPNGASQLVSAIDTVNGVNYVTAATYAPQGSLSALTLGYSGSFAGVQINDTYNSRLQLNETKAWSTAGVAMDLVYGFVDGNGLNNGNVVQVANSKDSTRSQSFTYDQLNRIYTAKTAATSGSNCWSYQYGIDVWSNVYSAQPLSGYSCTQGNLSLTINTNNQITNSGFLYDVSGNLTSDSATTYTWNAESQLKAVTGATYTYDGDGNRLTKSSGKIYWYGAGSEVLDESDASGNVTDEYVFFGGKRVAHRVISGGSIYYYAEDLLGSSRVITTASGVVCYEADFLPFGGERTITNTCPQNYKFTGKERDTETGNDEFGARYYSSSLMRWLSPDWSAIPAPVPYATLTNPQTLNLYGYVANNPETFGDIDGHLWPKGIQDPSLKPFDEIGANGKGSASSDFYDSYSGSIAYLSMQLQMQGQAQDQSRQNQLPNAAQMVFNQVKKEFSELALSEKNVKDLGAHNGHENIQVNGTVSKEQLAQIQETLSQNKGMFRPGSRIDIKIGDKSFSLHVESFQFSASGDTRNIQFQAHIDRGNPNRDAVGMVTHALVDGFRGATFHPHDPGLDPQ